MNLAPNEPSNRRSWPLAALLFAFIAVGPTTVEAEESAAPPLAVSALLAERDRSVARQIEGAKRSYLDGLDKFRLEWIEAGRTDDALLALKLKTQLEEGSTMSLADEGQDPCPELARVIETWEAVLQTHFAKANAVLAEQLRSVRSDAIRDGELDLAKVAEREIKSLTGAAQEVAPANPAIPESNPRELATRWQWGSGGTLQLLPNGVAVHSRWGNERGTWEQITTRRLRLIHPNGSVMAISIQRDGSGEVIAKEGGSTIIRPLAN